jgi:hypothetical protein
MAIITCSVRSRASVTLAVDHSSRSATTAHVFGAQLMLLVCHVYIIHRLRYATPINSVTPSQNVCFDPSNHSCMLASEAAAAAADVIVSFPTFNHYQVECRRRHNRMPLSVTGHLTQHPVIFGNREYFSSTRGSHTVTFDRYAFNVPRLRACLLSYLPSVSVTLTELHGLGHVCNLRQQRQYFLMAALVVNVSA